MRRSLESQISVAVGGLPSAGNLDWSISENCAFAPVDTPKLEHSAADLDNSPQCVVLDSDNRIPGSERFRLVCVGLGEAEPAIATDSSPFHTILPDRYGRVVEED